MTDTSADADDDQSAGSEQFDGFTEEEVSLGDIPPDKPWGADAYGAGGTETEDGVAERAARENPDPPDAPDRPVAALTEVDEPFDEDIAGQSIAELGDESGQQSAEEAAMHVYSPEEAVDHGLDPDGPAHDGYYDDGD